MKMRNYRQETDELIARIPEGTGLLLHSCCGPCSSAVLEELASHFDVTLLYYNPNIWPNEEYVRRRDEQMALLQKLPVRYPVKFEEAAYEPKEFLQAAQGLEGEPEGGARCEACFALRLRRAAETAAARRIPWYTTTLTVSPHKNAPLLNRLGEEIGAEVGVKFLPSDFKKRDGYKRSLALSREYGLYRQNWCGCAFSYRQTENGRKTKEKE